jgi:ribosomal protein S18 acetylase RimI-like enzyme
MPASPQSRIHLLPIGPDDWQLWRKARLQALAEAPYAFSSKLADWRGEGDRQWRWRSRLAEVPFNLVSYLDHEAAGMVSVTAPEETTVELISMWVAPFARGQGVGNALVTAVIGWGKEQAAARISLAVVQSNLRAIALYRRHGFVDGGSLDSDDPSIPPERRMIRDLNE